MGSINNILALIQIMAWCRSGDKPFIWTNADPVHWRIYAALGGDEWIHSVAVTSQLANGSTAFIWKLHCHWLKGSSKHYLWKTTLHSKCNISGITYSGFCWSTLVIGHCDLKGIANLYKCTRYYPQSWKYSEYLKLKSEYILISLDISVGLLVDKILLQATTWWEQHTTKWLMTLAQYTSGNTTMFSTQTHTWSQCHKVLYSNTCMPSRPHISQSFFPQTLTPGTHSSTVWRCMIRDPLYQQIFPW